MNNALSKVQIPRPRQLVSSKLPDINQLLQWREEAMIASSVWRQESWRDCEMYDGSQWTEEDYRKAKNAGIPYVLTINHTFPTVNLLLGSQINNKYDIIAKARTVKDSELNQTMTEGIKFVMDQWDGEFKISQAFRDGVIPGIGWMMTGYSADPRKERVKISYKDWKEVWWDPYSPPWVDIENTRYMFTQRWMDVIDLQAIFWEKAKEIEEITSEMANASVRTASSYIWDEATIVEEEIRYNIGTGWTNASRKRIRPCELWYTNYVTAMFAIMPDGTALEIAENLPPIDQFQLVRAATQIAVANIKKLRVATFLGSLLLDDVPSPFSHDEYPFIPFVGYIDRFNGPYGVPRNLRDQEEEINRRRSMALALLNSRRVIAEEDVASKEMSLQDLYDEVNKPDGFLVVAAGSIGKQKIQIQDQAKLMPPQISLMQESKDEIHQISGANNELLGYKSNAVSDVAMRNRQQSGSTMTVSLFDNHRRSLGRLGGQVACLIQGSWSPGKILRITDRLSGAEKYVEICRRLQNSDGSITIKNNITQTKFDTVIAEQPINDTIREANLNMIIEWIKRSPPQIIPQLVIIGMELSNIPNRDQILSKLKPLLGINPLEEDMTEEERKQKLIEQLQAESQKKQAVEEMQMAGAQLDLQNKQLTNEQLLAQIRKIFADIQANQDNTAIAQDKNQVNRERIHMEGIKTGVDLSRKDGEQRVKTAKTLHDMGMAEADHQLEARKADFEMGHTLLAHGTDVAQQNFENKLMLRDNLQKTKDVRGDSGKQTSEGVIGGRTPSPSGS